MFPDLQHKGRRITWVYRQCTMISTHDKIQEVKLEQLRSTQGQNYWKETKSRLARTWRYPWAITPSYRITCKHTTLLDTYVHHKDMLETEKKSYLQKYIYVFQYTAPRTSEVDDGIRTAALKNPIPLTNAYTCARPLERGLLYIWVSVVYDNKIAAIWRNPDLWRGSSYSASYTCWIWRLSVPEHRRLVTHMDVDYLIN